VQGEIIIKCNGCDREMARKIVFDTADLPELLIKKAQYAQRILLDHRKDCPIYRVEKEGGKK